jgi:hypothetical protein
MDCLEKVLRLEEVRDPVERVIVDQNRAQQALLGLDIMWCAAVGGGGRVGSKLEDVRIRGSHGSDCRCNFVGCGAAIKRLSRAKRKQKLIAYAPFFKMWMTRFRSLAGA